MNEVLRDSRITTASETRAFFELNHNRVETEKSEGESSPAEEEFVTAKPSLRAV